MRICQSLTPESTIETTPIAPLHGLRSPHSCTRLRSVSGGDGAVLAWPRDGGPTEIMRILSRLFAFAVANQTLLGNVNR